MVSRVDLGELVEENIHLLKSTIPKNVSLTLQLLRPIATINADAGQLHQVIMNLITNAWEACGDQSGGITITTGEGEFDAAYLGRSRLQEVPPAGRFVYLEVDDTGCGMDGETQRCLFDPFFTTKFTGRGLGMSAILGIVKSHRGAIVVESEPGRGSVIRVLLPVPDELPATECQGDAVSSVADGFGAYQGKVVLLVDDEEMVRDVCKKMLEFLGYTVITAADGFEGLEAFRRHGDDIGCVVLDLSMPNMDGLTAFKEIMSLRSDARVVLSSGFSEKVATGRFAAEGLAGFIQKPYELEKLQEVLSRALDRKARPTP
jgi:CheY-like chemotaxis protein